MTKPKTNKERTLIIDRPVATMLLRLFDTMYKRGVNDAMECGGDNGLIHEYLERTMLPGVFGLLNDNTSEDWLYFQIQLEREVWSKGFREPFMRYCRNMGKYGRNYLSVGLLCALDWYRQGLQDYLGFGCADISLFNGKAKARLTKDGFQNMSNHGMVSDTQNFCFKRNKIDAERESKLRLKDKHYSNFIRAIGLASASRYDMMN